MAITTVDGIIAGSVLPPRFFYKVATPALVVGRPYSSWGLGGVPGAGAFDTTLNGVTLSSTSAMVNGQIPFTDPGSGNSYLGRFAGGTQSGGSLMLLDRLWHNGGFTAVTSAQSITSPTWPARDNNGSTNGDGVLIGLEYNATGANNAPTVSLSYTNSVGTSGKTANTAVAVTANPPAGHFFPFALVAGDIGVRSVQSCTFSVAPTAGTCNLVAYRVLGVVECPGPGIFAIDPITTGLPQMFNGTVPFIGVFTIATSAQNLFGLINVLRG